MDHGTKTNEGEVKPKHKFSPFWMLWANVLLGGLGYLYLHEYNRFYALYAIAFATAFIGIPFANLIIWIFIAYDGYTLAKKANETGKMPAYNKTKLYAAIFLFVAVIVIAIWSTITYGY
jgi:hypothetical protein